ncbi:hypothetical protein [Candidatus Atelocyanobacterium thalassae]
MDQVKRDKYKIFLDYDLTIIDVFAYLEEIYRFSTLK